MAEQSHAIDVGHPPSALLRIVNPMLFRTQIFGAALQGLGYALMEGLTLEEGRVTNVNLHEYKIPTMADIPAIETIFVGEADVTANHTGARGLAEPPIIAIAPAIANAVANAIGGEVGEIPLTPWRVLAAVNAAGS